MTEAGRDGGAVRPRRRSFFIARIIHQKLRSTPAAGDHAAERRKVMDKWMRRRLDYLRSQLQRQEVQLDVAKGQQDPDAVSRMERQIETTKSEMVRVIGG
jgi:hypothetical protein